MKHRLACALMRSGKRWKTGEGGLPPSSTEGVGRQGRRRCERTASRCMNAHTMNKRPHEAGAERLLEGPGSTKFVRIRSRPVHSHLVSRSIHLDRPQGGFVMTRRRKERRRHERQCHAWSQRAHHPVVAARPSRAMMPAGTHSPLSTRLQSRLRLRLAATAPRPSGCKGRPESCAGRCPHLWACGPRPTRCSILASIQQPTD